MLKSIYIGFSFSNHGKHAGYNQIKNYYPYDKIIDCQKSFNFLNAIFKKRTILSRICIRLMGGRIWWVELKLIFLSMFNPNKLIFHIIYGENVYKYLGYFKFGNKIVLTLHQPTSYFEATEQKFYLKNLKSVDKIIVMSYDMQIYFQNKFPNKPVLFIPHGVDNEFFKPNGIKKNQVLMIGNWLRNFDFAAKVFNYINIKNPNISIVVITNKENNAKFINNNSVILLNSISDGELLELYQSSKIVFLPLYQYTANNAVLEACSCGCKVIVSSSMKSPNYSNTPIDFISEDIEIVCKNINNIITNWDLLIEEDNREYINKNFSWRKIAIETHNFIVN